MRRPYSYSAEVKKLEGTNQHTIILKRDGEAWLNHGYTGGLDGALKLALDRRRSYVEECQAKLIKAQADAMHARQMLEAVEKLIETPKGWDKVEV